MADDRRGWFVEWDDFDESENHLAMAQFEDRVQLRARNSEEAISEAVEEVRNRKWRHYKGWDKKLYPHSPRLVYRLPMEDPT
ncbi:MAG: hypothetical protein GY769_07775 [bacterium]|nr:hypothetical protein [bacterium]